jgi:hypothetical protein
LVHPDVVSSYAGHKTRSLHDRSLVFNAGEDQYLTGLLHRSFPDRRIVYLPSATFQFTATAVQFSDYVQEQQLLLTSTFHNLWTQIWSPRLRGSFCCSINFLALIEWLALILTPAITVMTWAVLVVVMIGAITTPTSGPALYSLPMVLVLALMLSLTLLQPLLGVCLSGIQERRHGRRWHAIIKNIVGLCLFLVTMPFKSVIVAAVAYWRLGCKSFYFSQFLFRNSNNEDTFLTVDDLYLLKMLDDESSIEISPELSAPPPKVGTVLYWAEWFLMR